MTDSDGITNFQIKDAFKKLGNEDLLENFIGVFPSNYMNKFIDHAAMIADKGKYPFIIANTDGSDKPGVHWWSILDIEPRTDIYFFDSFGLDGLKNFIAQDDKRVVDKILSGIEKMTRADQKITLCKVKFNLGACKKLTKKEIDSLSDTARNFFMFVQDFGIKLKLRGFVNIWMVEDRVQDLDSSTCGIFQIYYYHNLFNPKENSSIVDHKKLTKNYELFSLEDQAENEMKMEEYADKIGIAI